VILRMHLCSRLWHQHLLVLILMHNRLWLPLVVTSTKGYLGQRPRCGDSQVPTGLTMSLCHLLYHRWPGINAA
jgi:hypothetical protein